MPSGRAAWGTPALRRSTRDRYFDGTPCNPLLSGIDEVYDKIERYIRGLI